MNKTHKCILDCKKYTDKKNKELNGCSDEYKIKNSLFPFFNHLSTFFPTAYEHMLKELKLE